jgi:transcriptional regulator of aromatic amino acid metabolism
MPRRIPIACEELRRLYEHEKMGIVSLAQRYGCSPSTISNRLHHCGIPVRSSRFQPRHVPPDELRRLYEDERLPLKEIASRLGVSVSTIGNRRRALGIPPRSPQAQRTCQECTNEKAA